MATIVNNPGGGTGGNGDSGMGMVLGVVIGILLVIFLIVYGVPFLRDGMRGNPEPASPGVEINLPDVTPGNSGSQAQ
jgi:hypothetical protein